MSRSRRSPGRSLAAITILIATALLAAGSAGAQNENWWPGFVPPGVDGGVSAIAATESYVYVAGSFETAGGVPCENIARWNGTKWEALGDGLNQEVNCLYLWGNDLYAGGYFTYSGDELMERIAHWDPGLNQWFGMGDGFGDEVFTITTHNGKLFAGGEFWNSGETVLYRVAWWDGFDWNQAGLNILNNWDNVYDGIVYDLVHFWSELWVAGNFNQAGGIDVNYIAAIDDHDGSWHGVGDEPWGLTGVALCLEPWSEELYIGGGFTGATGVDSDDMIRHTAGGGFGAVADGGAPYVVSTLAGRVGGYMAVGSTLGVHKYTVAPGEWQGEMGDIESVKALEWQVDKLYAGGSFSPHDSWTDGVGIWDGEVWKRLGLGIAFWWHGTAETWQDRVECLLNWNGGIVAGGYFHLKPIDETEPRCYNIAYLDGDHWYPLGPGFNYTVNDLEVYDGELIAIGEFDMVQAGNGYIARWTGTEWQILGNVLGLGSRGETMQLFQGDLIAGGWFNDVDDIPMSRVARWDGDNWNAMGAGLDGIVLDLEVFGGELYAGGSFNGSDGVPMPGIARWDGAAWQAVGGSLDDDIEKVEALEVHEGMLYAGGDFTAIGGIPADGIAAWNGVAWQPVGAGVADGEFSPCVYSLKSTDVGLFVGGDFATAGGVAANSVARYTSRGWEALGDGVTGGFNATMVNAFLVHEGELYLGGDFDHAGGKLSVSMARWREDMTPSRLSRFSIRAEGGAVVVEWESESASPPEFELIARLSGDEWAVDVEALPGGIYRARDASPLLAAGGEVEYRLLGREDGGGWQLLRSGTILLAPPAPAPPVLAARPNPFNPRVELSFSLPAVGRVGLTIHDLRGRRVATLVDGPCPTGASAISWDGRDDAGRELASGVYLARLATESGTDALKLVLLR